MQVGLGTHPIYFEILTQRKDLCPGAGLLKWTRYSDCIGQEEQRNRVFKSLCLFNGFLHELT